VIALLEAKRAGLFGRQAWPGNILAGVVVGIVALPLGMAFAIASGAQPQQGLYTAIVAALVTSIFGGTRVQISGPTGAFVVILAGITATYGFDGLQVATLMAGAMLLAMGLARLGGVIKFIPSPVIVGFTAGIALVIWVGQWKYFFGLHPAVTGTRFHEQLWALCRVLPQLDVSTTLVGLGTLGVLVLGKRLLSAVPGLNHVPAPLLAMLLATAVTAALSLQTVATIGSAFGGIPRALPVPHWPALTVAQALQLVGPAFTIALLGAIESLLTAVVADGMTGARHDPNQELIAQGAANLLTPLFGGFAATGAVARTATSVRNGATSPLAGIVHSVFLILVIVLLAPWASAVPLAALAAILFHVAWNMSDAGMIVRLLRTASRSDQLLLLMTFVLTVFVDLVVAVNAGIVLASLLFMRRMAGSVRADQQVFSGGSGIDEADNAAITLPDSVLVYRIDGPLFFGAAEKLQSALERVEAHIDMVVLRLGRVPFIDATGTQTLYELVARFQKRRTRVVLCGIHPGVRSSLEQAGVLRLVGAQNLCANMGEVAELARR
jgi:SulP family sulfate permease